MLREFAVEPALLGDYNEFRYLSEKFGVQKARMIALFPKKWPRMVHEAAAGFTEIQKKRLEEWLARKDKFLVPGGRDYDVSADWLHNAELAYEQRPFRAILATENPRGHEKVLLPYGIPLDREPLFNCPHEIFMPRKPEEFVAITDLLLRCSRQIVFVDPQVRADDRWGEALSAMLNCAHPEATIRYCAIDFSSQSKMETKEFRLGKLKEKWPRFIPEGKVVEFILLDKDVGMDTHNRFILTERGGIKFAWGLDTSLDGSKDVVNVMAEETHAVMFNEYYNLAGRSVLERVEIIGAK